MDHSSFVSHDTSTEINKSSTFDLPPPVLTWEQYILLNLEIERLSTANRHLLVENEAFKAQADKGAAAASENDQLRARLAKAEHEASVLKTHTTRMFDLEIRIAALVKENQGFSSQLGQKLKELDTWSLRYDEVNEAAMRYSSLHQTRVAENEELQVEILRMKQEIDNIELIKGQSKQLSNQLKELSRSRDDLKATLTKKDQEISDLKKRLANARDFGSGLQMSEGEREILQRDYEDSQALVEELRARVDEVEEQLALVCNEKDKTSSVVRERQREIEELKRTAKEVGRLQEKLEAVEKEKEQLKGTIAKKADDYEKSKEEIKQLLLLGAHRHKEIERLKSQVYNLTQSEKNSTKEKEKLSVLLLQKTRDVEELKVEIQAMYEKNKNAFKKGDKQQEEKEAKEYKNKMKRIADAERKLQSLLNENKRLAQENDRLSIFLIEKTKEAERFRDRRSKINALTPKTSMASIGAERISFGELALQRIRETDGPRKSAPLNLDGSEESVDAGSPSKKVYTMTALDKDKVITQLSARVLDYERQLNGLANQKKKSASVEKKRLMRSNTEQVKSMKELRVKTMTGVESISEFSTPGEERDRLASKVEQQKREIESLRSELRSVKGKYENELTVVLKEKEQLHSVMTEKLAEIDAIMIKMKEMENELNKAIEQTRAIVRANDDPKLVAAMEKKMKNVEEVRTRFMTLEKVYTNMKDVDQSDTATNESPTRTSTVQVLTEEGMTKRKDKLNGMKKIEREKSSTAELKRSNFSFDALTMSPDASPIFDSKWF